MILGFQKCCLPSCLMLMKRTSSAYFMDRSNQGRLLALSISKKLKDHCDQHTLLERETGVWGADTSVSGGAIYALQPSSSSYALTAVVGSATCFWVFGLTPGHVFRLVHPDSTIHIRQVPPCWNVAWEGAAAMVKKYRHNCARGEVKGNTFGEGSCQQAGCLFLSQGCSVIPSQIPRSSNTCWYPTLILLPSSLKGLDWLLLFPYLYPTEPCFSYLTLSLETSTDPFQPSHSLLTVSKPST